MKDADDNFLARWSRRKREVAGAEAPGIPEALPASSLGTGEPESQRGEQPDEGSGSALDNADPAAEPLPDLESLTAESDVSAFLRKGVPEALKAAALRRMWSLDPAIRDHVGPAEYAWDFNQPSSIAGFGPAPAFLPKAGTYTTPSQALNLAAAPEAAAAPAPAPRSVRRPEPPLLQARPSGEDPRAGADDQQPDAAARRDAHQEQPGAATAPVPPVGSPGDTPGIGTFAVRHGGARPR